MKIYRVESKERNSNITKFYLKKEDARRNANDEEIIEFECDLENLREDDILSKRFLETGWA